MHPSTQRVASTAESLGLQIKIIEFDQSTGTAEDAAQAIGCEVGQIVKSLVFVVEDEPVLALVSGQNQLDTGKLAAIFQVGKKKVKRADATLVKEATGFSIGGVSPIGHTSELGVFIDQDLTYYDEVWAAAGTPHSVFAISPPHLQKATGGRVADLKR